MKMLNSPSFKQSGFTLIESLVALMIFSIIILGSAAAVSYMLKLQKEMQVNSIIINTIQNKLQNALNTPASASLCSSIDLNSFSLAQQTYHMACATEKIDINGIPVEWPVLAVSTQKNIAQSCAEGTLSSDCYIVGK